MHSFSPAKAVDVQKQEKATAAERRTDIQWGSPIFRAPSLPTPQQLSNELPFTVNIRGKSPRRA